MDLIFQLSNGDRATSLLNLMNYFSCSYICLWTYSSDTNFLYCIECYYHDETASQLIATSSSSGSIARRFFDEYKASLITFGNDLVPGLAFKHRNPYLELQELDLFRLASVESQRQFYKIAVFLGCERGEIELGMSYIPQMSLEIKMQNIFPQDFARQHSSPMVHSNIPPPPQQPQQQPQAQQQQQQQQQSCRASPSSSFSLDSPEYSSLFYAIPSSSNPYLQEQSTPTTTTQTIPITTTCTITNLIPFPSQESTDAALTRAYLAILSASPSSSTASSQQQQQTQEVGSAFKRYPTTGLSPIIGSSSNLRRQTMLKRAIAYFRGLNFRRLQEQQALIGSRPTSNQLHHMISERRRRKKINESFQALRSLLPPGTKKDKTSVLRTTKEYLSSIKSQLSELSKRNEFLEAQVFPRNKETTTKQIEISTNERLSVWITPISESTSTSGDHHRLVDLQVALRGDYPATNLIIRVLEFLNQVRQVCLISMESQTLQEQTVGDHPSPTSWATFRLRIEGTEWDESAFKEAVRRILADLAQ